VEHTESQLRDVVALAGRILDGLGLVDYLGHVSARVPGTDEQEKFFLGYGRGQNQTTNSATSDKSPPTPRAITNSETPIVPKLDLRTSTTETVESAPQQVFALPVPVFESRWEPATEIYKVIIEKDRAGLERIHHRRDEQFAAAMRLLKGRI
jgi:hypothetical protein